MPRTYTVEQLAEVVGGVLRGDGSVVVTGVADLREAQSHQATWFSSEKYRSAVAQCRAGVVLLPADFGPTPMPAILCERVDRSVARLLGAFADPLPRPEPGVHPSAIVHETARIGEDVAVGPFAVVEANVSVGPGSAIHAGVFIGAGTTVGRDCMFWPNVVVREGCVVGNRVTIHPGAVIGADGLGFYFDEGRHQKVPHIGGVRVGDDVEIGACTCIDRSKFGFTVIGNGTKIDNQVQVAHNVRIGEHCVIAAQSALAGSVRIGNYCILGGRAAVVDNVVVGDGARLSGGLAVATKNVAGGERVSGMPARHHSEWRREQASLRRLPELAALLKDLTARVKRLESSADHQSRGGV